MFWGLIMESSKRYTQTVEKPFHVSQAALDLNTADADPVQVLLSYENRNYLLCTLQKDRFVQNALDLNFQVGDKVSFATSGAGHVHLTGYLIPEEDDLDYLDEEEEDDEEVPKLEPPQNLKKRKAALAIPKENKKQKTTVELLNDIDENASEESDDPTVSMTDLLVTDEDEDSDEKDEAGEEENAEEDDDDEDEDEDDDTEEEESEVEIQTPQKPQKKVTTPKQNGFDVKAQKFEKTAKQNKTPQAKEKSPKAEKTPKTSEKTPKTPKDGSPAAPQKLTLQGGVMIEDLKVGEGAIAKPGRIVTVYYEGRLKMNNKLFDSTTSGHGFSFNLGKEEVIKGWDVGVSGMKIGGKRRIVCPPNMAYGSRGSPPVIPKNSTLVFEVELKNVK